MTICVFTSKWSLKFGVTIIKYCHFQNDLSSWVLITWCIISKMTLMFKKTITQRFYFQSDHNIRSKNLTVLLFPKWPYHEEWKVRKHHTDPINRNGIKNAAVFLLIYALICWNEDTWKLWKQGHERCHFDQDCDNVNKAEWGKKHALHQEPTFFFLILIGEEG